MLQEIGKLNASGTIAPNLRPASVKNVDVKLNANAAPSAANSPVTLSKIAFFVYA